MKLHRRIARYLWIAFATLIILLAVAVTLARVLLPYLDSYRSSIESRVSAYLGQPVAIEQLDARLLGLTPSIILRKVTLKSATANEPIAHFDEISVGLDLFATLRKRQPVLHELVLGGARFAVVRRKDGTFAVEGLVKAQQQNNAPTDTSTLGAWLLMQKRLAVRGSTLVWRDEVRNRSLRFDHVDIELVNSGERHRLNGSVALPEDGGKALKVAVDVHGNPLAGLAWDGTIYVKAEALRPLYWLPLFSNNVPELPIKSGELSAEMWSTWKQGVAIRSEGNFLVRNAILSSEKLPSAMIKEFSGELLWQRRDEGWDLDLQRMVLALGSEARTESRIHLAHRNQTDLLLADRLKLDDLAKVAIYSQLLPEEQLQRLQALAPRGEVRSLRAERGADGTFSTQGEFYALGMNAWESVPGFDGATGHWRADNQGGEVYLDSHTVSFDAPRLFRVPLHVDSLAAALSFHRMDQGWRLEGRNIAASNADVSARGEVDMQFEPGQKPYLDLRLDFWNGLLKQVPRYVPAKIMGPGVVKWLDGAFSNGVAHHGTLLFHGRTGDFPFYDKAGVFETRFQAEDVHLNFAAGWPRLNNVNGEVLFDNQGMMITPHSGTLFNTAINQASIDIADLKAPVLDVNITASPPAEDVLRLFRETPLATHIGSALSGMEASGRNDLKLSLRLPLSDATAEKAPLHYEGDIALHDVQLQVWKGVTFRQLNGTVSFSDNDFRSTGLLGQVFDAPVTLDIKTDDTSRTIVSAHGHVTADSLRRYMQLPLLDRLAGESDWHGMLYLPRGEGSHPSLELHSPLTGMAVQLPVPVGKPAEESVPLAVRLAFGEDSAKRVSVAYGDRVAGRFAFAGEEMQLQRASLHFGAGSTELPKEGWRIGGTLENLDWSRWRDLLPSSSGNAAHLPLVIDMNRLSMVPIAPNTSGESTNPDHFPQLDLHVKDFSYDDWHLGEMTGSSRSDSQHWDIPDLRFKGPHHTIKLSAHWQAGQRSKLGYSATSDNVGEMLKAFGFASVINGGKGTISGNMDWDGVLSDFSWARAEGNLAVDVNEGSLVEVNPGAGRLFGLLSLEALPRRLTLDFRDLFQKGLRFDEIKGNINIAGGNAYTKDLYIKSPSAGILVEGRTGLVKRDYDQIISVVPNVSSSVSIASAIAWGPQVAAAVLLFQNIFKKDLAKVTMIRYSVKGSWDDPQFTRLQ